MPRPALASLLLAALSLISLSACHRSAPKAPTTVYHSTIDDTALSILSDHELEFTDLHHGPFVYQYKKEGNRLQILNSLANRSIPRYFIASQKHFLADNGNGYCLIKNPQAFAVFQAGFAKDRQHRGDGLADLTHVIELDPDFTPAYLERAHDFVATRQFDLAAADLAKAAAQDDTIPMLHALQGNVAYEQGDLKAAIAHLRRAIELDPDRAEYHNNLAALLEKDNQTTEAVAELRQAATLAPKEKIYRINLGSLFIRLNKYEEGAQIYQKLLEDDPENASFLCNYGVALFFQGKNDEAIRTFQHALRINPNLKDAQENLATALRNKNKASTPTPAPALTPPALAPTLDSTNIKLFK